MMASAFANLIGTGNYQSLRETLTDNPALANTGIPCSDDDPRLGHIEQGADIFYAGGDGATALHWCWKYLITCCWHHFDRCNPPERTPFEYKCPVPIIAGDDRYGEFFNRCGGNLAGDPCSTQVK